MRILIIDDSRRSGADLTVGPGLGSFGGSGLLPSVGGPSGPASRPPRAASLDLEGPELRHVLQQYGFLTPVLPSAATNGRPEEPAPLIESDADSADPTLSRLVDRIGELVEPRSGVVQFGEITVELVTHAVYRGGRPVKVTQKEFRVLYALMRRQGQPLSRAELMEEVWGPGSGVSLRVIDTHVARLRRKLEQDPARPRHLLTALNQGYRFQM